MGLIYKDMTGRKIEVGNFIAFAVAVRRRADLRVGIVLELTQTKTQRTRYNYTNHVQEAYDEPKVKILSAEFSNEYTLKDDGKYVMTPAAWHEGRVSTLANLSNMMLVSPTVFDPVMRNVLIQGAVKRGVVPLDTVDIKGQIRGMILENGIEKVAVAFDEMQEESMK